MPYKLAFFGKPLAEPDPRLPKVVYETYEEAMAASALTLKTFTVGGYDGLDQCFWGRVDTEDDTHFFTAWTIEETK